MNDSAKVVAKVLVLERDAECFELIKAFCEANKLMAQRVEVNNFVEALEVHVDLAGIFLPERTGDDGCDGLTIGRLLRRSRPELPLFLRRETTSSLEDLTQEAKQPFTQAYTIDNMAVLQQAISESIFSTDYPSALVQGLTEIAKAALDSQFIGMKAETDTPYVVLDKLIFGEIFTLIPIETSWCRGYMMLQVEEDALLALVNTQHTYAKLEHSHDFRNLNGILNEVTNMIWGAFKNKYMGAAMTDRALSQVPMVINPGHQHISFGSDNPQLCLKHTLKTRDGVGSESIDVYQKFVFNMNWNPEDFKENEAVAEDLVDSGELEMF